MRKTIQVIKIGGNIIDDDKSLQKFLDQFSEMDSPRILVHGGGRRASEISRRLGIDPKMVEGRRVTDEDSLEIVTMVYGGLINKNIVADLQARNTEAIGLCGADMNLIPAWKRKNTAVDYGFVGDFDPARIRVDRLEWLIDNGIIPVICALTHDEKGSLLNTNADSLAAGIASSLAAARPVELHLCFEKRGVLSDVEDDNSIIPELIQSDFIRMRAEGSVIEGMIPKLENAFTALEKGVNVVIRHALDIKSGTRLRNDE
ncbi:MAG: acetylglutamate kinase [Cyclobacteriaceae bacterium]